MKFFKITDTCNGREVVIVAAMTERGAKLKFRRSYALEYAYPWITATEVSA